MKCKNLKYRTKKGIKYLYCTKRKEICSKDNNICLNCAFKEFKTYKSLSQTSKLKTYSKKRAKIERKRYSILTDDMNKCFFCDNPKDDIHEIYPGSKRIISMKNGFCVPFCRKCHDETQNNRMKMLFLQQKCQKKYESDHSREDFINLVGKNYL